MKASVFFKVIRHGRKIYSRERNILLADLTDVVMSPLGKDTHEEIRGHFMGRAFPKSKPKALPADDVRTFHIV